MINNQEFLEIFSIIQNIPLIVPRENFNIGYKYSEAIEFVSGNKKENSFPDKSLAALILRLEIESGKTAAQIYHDANLERASYHNIIYGINSNPKKKTVLALSIGLHLDEKNMTKLLYYCGYTFPSSDTDRVVLYFIRKKEDYDNYDINSKNYERGKAIRDLNNLLKEFYDRGTKVEFLGTF